METRVYHDNPEGDLIETWNLDQNDLAVCDRLWGQESMEMHGVIGKGGRLYYPRDGSAFLRYLPYEYANSSFARAVVIE